MASVMTNVLSYFRVPMIASSSVAVLVSGLLYFKQKYYNSDNYTDALLKYQSEIIYPRNFPPEARTNVPRPPQFGIEDFEELMLPTPDGESLSAFLIRPSNKQRASNVTILMFHGNAGNIGYRLPIARVLEQEMGCSVFMLQYRGYGLSTGTPNEKGLKIDAQTGLDYVRQRAELKDTKIVIYGQSLGGAVGVGLAAKNQQDGDIAGIVLENTFLSIRKMIPAAFPPAKYLAPLCHQIWPTEEMIPRITKIPFLFLSGLKDEIVPASHMKQLYQLCRAETKIWKELPNGTHNDTVAEPGYFEAFDDFIREHVLDHS